MEHIAQWHDIVESTVRDYHIYDIHSQKVTQVSLIFCSAEELIQKFSHFHCGQWGLKIISGKNKSDLAAEWT